MDNPHRWCMIAPHVGTVEVEDARLAPPSQRADGRVDHEGEEFHRLPLAGFAEPARVAKGDVGEVARREHQAAAPVAGRRASSTFGLSDL